MVLFSYSFWLTTHWEELSNLIRILLCVVSIIVLGLTGDFLKRNTEFEKAGRLLIFAAAGIIPLLIYSIEKMINIWPGTDTEEIAYFLFLGTIKGAWVLLDLISLIILILVFRLVKDHLLTILVSNFAYFLILDLSGLLFGIKKGTEAHYLLWLFGGIIIATWGIYYYYQKNTIFARWPSIFGLLMIFSATSWLAIVGKNEFGYALLGLIISTAMILVSIGIESKIYLTFGSIGIFWFVDYLVFSIFFDSFGFTLTTLAIGLATISLGMMFQKNKNNLFPFLQKTY